MAFSLIEATSKFLLKKRFRGHSPIHYYPTEASVKIRNEYGEEEILGHCHRASWYRCMGYAGKPATVYLEMTALVGKAVEEAFIERWKQMGIYEANNVKFLNHEYHISGEIDAVLRDPETNRLIAIENKTFYGYHAEKEILGNKKKMGRPKAKHLLQSIIYAYEFKKDFDYVKVYYTERGNGHQKEFDVAIAIDQDEDGNVIHRPMIDNVPILEFTVEDIYERYAILDHYVRTQTIPEREFELKFSNEKVELMWEREEISKSAYEAFKKISKKDGSVRYSEKDRPGSWQCSWCPYSERCWNDTIKITDSLNEF